MPRGGQNKHKKNNVSGNDHASSATGEAVHEPVCYDPKNAPFYQVLIVTAIEHLKNKYYQARPDSYESSTSASYKQTVWHQLLETAQSQIANDAQGYYQNLTKHLKEVKQANNEATEKDGCHVGELQGYCQAAIDLIDEMNLLHHADKLVEKLSKRLNMDTEAFQHFKHTSLFFEWLDESFDEINQDVAKTAVAGLLKDYWLEKKLDQCVRTNVGTASAYLVESGKRAFDKVAGDNGVKQTEKEKLVFKRINQLLFIHKTQSKEAVCDYGQSVKDDLVAMQVANKQIEYDHSSKLQHVYDCAFNAYGWFNNPRGSDSHQSKSKLDQAVEPLLDKVEQLISKATNKPGKDAEEKPAAASTLG